MHCEIQLRGYDGDVMEDLCFGNGGPAAYICPTRSEHSAASIDRSLTFTSSDESGYGERRPEAESGAGNAGVHVSGADK